MLAQASPPELDILAIAGWIVALIAAAVLLAVAIVAVKRWMFRDQEEAAATPWTLHDLLTLRDSGELTIQQYERLRADVIRTLKEPGPAEKETGRDAAADGPRTAPEGDSLA